MLTDRHELRLMDPALVPIADKLAQAQPLSLEDGLTLYRTPDIHGVGRLAHARRTQLHGDVVYYNRNRHINYTNLCALSCKFCSFYRKRGEEGAYEMPVEQVVEVARKAYEGGATEVHIVGGLHPWQKFDYYLQMLRQIRSAAPLLHIKAFTAIEIVHFSRIARLSVAEVLTELRDAGLGSLPGGGAEIFDDRVHDAAFKGKVREDKWFDVHRTAHSLGIFSNATILYGHIEGLEERVRHFIKLRDLQAESLSAAGLDPSRAPDSASVRPERAFFNCVIPLSFIPEHSELGYLPGPTGLTDLRTLAVARLMLHNISHIKAFWIMQGVGLAQIALDYGCDDLDGTVVWYDITKRAGNGTNHQELHENELRRLIRESGKVPVERDTLYRRIRRNPEGQISEPLDLSPLSLVSQV
jgi:aminodeoxyfutalosine synthase